MMNFDTVLDILRHAPNWQERGPSLDATEQAQLAQFRVAQETLENASLYRQMSRVDAIRLSQEVYNMYLANPIRQNKNIVGSILVHIATIIPHALQHVQRSILFDGKYDWWPRERIFIGADDSVTDALLSHIELGTLPPQIASKEVILETLAWIDGEKVVRAISDWKKRGVLKDTEYWNLNNCLRNAGWELTSTGRRRDVMLSEKCILIGQTQEDKATQVTSAQLLPEICRWCYHSLIALFHIDLRQSDFYFIKMTGEKLTIPLCPYCTVQNIYQYYQVDGYGNVKWSDLTPTPHEYWRHEEDDFTEFLLNSYSVQKSHSLYAWGEGGPTIGGHPDWYHDSQYPQCPKCTQTMIFVAQNDQTNQDGMFYSFLCFNCNLVTTGFQT